MKFLADAYSEVLKRAGEGYANYADRACICYWKAIDAIIKSGEYEPLDIAGITDFQSEDIPLSDFPAVMAEQYDVEFDKTTILQIEGATYVFSRVDYAAYATMNQHRLAMSQEAGIKEIIWTEHNNEILLTPSAGITTNPIVTVKTRIVGITDNTLARVNASTELIKNYTTVGFAMRAVEMATQLIIQELRG